MPSPSSAPVPAAAPKTWRAGTLTYTTSGLVLLFFWLLWGDFAWSMRDRVTPTTVQILFHKFGASDTLVGTLFASLPAAVGLVLGPLIGYRSDRLRSRWGRRIPFLALPTPFIVCSMVGLAFSPQIGGFLHRFLPDGGGLSQQGSVLFCMGLFWTTFEISCITAQSVLYALINDVVPSELIGRFFGLFRAFSLLAGFIVNWWVLGKAKEHYVEIFLGIALLYGVGFTFMCLKVKEGAYPPPPPEPPASGAGGLLAAVRTYFQDSLGNPYYLLFFVVSVFMGLATMPFNIYSYFYAEAIGVDLDFYFKCIASSFVVSFVLAYPLGALVDRFHPLRVSLIVLALYGLVMLWAALCVRDARSFLVLLLCHTVLSGTFYTTSASIPLRLLPRAKFAEISSAGGIVGSLASIAMPPVLGAFLDRTHHAYVYVCHASVVLVAGALVTGWFLYRRFLALGGHANYRAPE